MLLQRLSRVQSHPGIPCMSEASARPVIVFAPATAAGLLAGTSLS